MLMQCKPYSFFLLTFILFRAIAAESQTQLKLILNTNKPIDSAMIVHWTDREIARMAFKDTMEVNFKTRGIDFYHINYKTGADKIYYAPVFLDTGKITVTSHIENEKLVIDRVDGSPMYQKYSRWRS